MKPIKLNGKEYLNIRIPLDYPSELGPKICEMYTKQLEQMKCTIPVLYILGNTQVLTDEGWV